MSPSSFFDRLTQQSTEEAKLESFGLSELGERELAQLSDLIGAEALAYLRSQEGSRFFGGEDQLKQEIVYLIHMYGRALELKFTRKLNRSISKTANASFVIWEDYLAKAPNETLISAEAVQANTLKFLHALKEFFRRVSPECEIKATGSDEQRKDFWKRQISSLNKEGHLNIVFEDQK